MRFISKYGEFSVNVRPHIEEAYASGLSRTTQRGLYAKFYPGGLLPDEREQALRTWAFNGLGQLEDEVTTVQPDRRIGRLDPAVLQQQEGWSDEERQMVEDYLLDYARTSPDVALVEEVVVPPPWPRYDAYQGGTKMLIRKLVDEGHDLEQVLAYERENQRRVDLILSLENLLGDPEQLAELQPEVEEVVG